MQKTTSSTPGWRNARPFGDRLVRLLVEQVEDHRQVVDAERPHGVLERPDHAEVHALAVEVEHVAERAGVDELLQRLHARVVEEQMAGHEHEVARFGERDELVHLGAAHRRWLLDEHVLARLERALGQGVVRAARRSRSRSPRRSRPRAGRRTTPSSARPGCCAAACSRCSGFASQSQTRSASSPKFRATFRPHGPRPTWPSLKASRPCRSSDPSRRLRSGGRRRAARGRRGRRSRSPSGP